MSAYSGRPANLNGMETYDVLARADAVLAKSCRLREEVLQTLQTLGAVTFRPGAAYAGSRGPAASAASVAKPVPDSRTMVPGIASQSAIGTRVSNASFSDQLRP